MFAFAFAFAKYGMFTSVKPDILFLILLCELV